MENPTQFAKTVQRNTAAVERENYVDRIFRGPLDGFIEQETSKIMSQKMFEEFTNTSLPSKLGFRIMFNF
jgi:hypothetical protein